MKLICNLRHIVLTLVALLGLSASAQINTDQVLRIGQNALYFEDYILSIQYFNQVIKAKPYLAEPYFFRAIAKYDLEDYKGAIEDASLCIDRNPFISDAYQVRAVSNMFLKDYSHALDDYHKVLTMLPENTTFLYNKGICEMETKQYDLADSTFHQVVKLQPKNESVYLGLAQLNLVRGDTTKAIDNINKSLSIKKSNVSAYGMLSDLYAHFKKDYNSAIVAMDSVIMLEPKNSNYYLNRAWLKYQVDDYFGTMSDYDYAITLDPDNTAAIYNRAQLNAQFGEDAKAIRDFSTVLQKEPSNFLALYNRAQLYLRTQQYRKAVGDYDRILKKYPNFESGYMQRANCKQMIGDKAGAQRDNEKAIAIFKKKGIHVASYNPADNEARIADRKIQKEIEDSKKMADQPETSEDIMKKFNQLLTVKNDNNLKPEYDNKSRGHIQNRDVEINPMPTFALTYYSPVNKLNGKTHYMKEVTEVNETRMLPKNKILSLSNVEVTLDEEEIQKRFASIEYYNGMFSTSTPRAIDYLARAIDFMMVKNPESAIADANRAINLSPKLTLAYYLKADAHYMQYELEQRNKAKAQGTEAQTSVTKQTSVSKKQEEASADAMLHQQHQNPLLLDMIADLNEVLKLSPKNVYALYNRGNAYLLLNDYTSAINCFSEAISLKPDLGEAYYNRGLMYLKLGNRDLGIADLSKAGELGILPSYNVIKRMAR